MRLPALAVRRPVTTLMVFCAALLLGGAALTRLRLDLLPEIEPPVVSVLTYWPGATATDVESELTKYIEDQLVTVNNLDEIVSKSVDNLSVVMCKFDWGTDLDVATNDVRDKLDLARKDLPENVAEEIEEPLIFKFSSATAPILIIEVTARESYPYLYHLVDKRISDELKRVPGVGAIVLYGGLRRQIRVELDPRRMEAFGLWPERIGRILAAENLNLPAGSIKVGKREIFLRVPGRFADVDQIRNTVIGSAGGRVLYLKDVATVRDAFEEVRMKGWANGQPAVVMIVQKQTGTNTVEVVRRVRQRLREIARTLPSDVRVTISMDASELIVWSIENLRSSLLVGICLVVAVTLAFLRSWRASLIVALAIPFSLIVAFLFMFLFDFTVNIVTLASLTVSAGMVVDNAIVVLESIARRLEEGQGRVSAAVEGASEVGLAISASTLTTVVVFVPLMFLRGFVGIVFRQLALVIVTTILGSLFISLTLVPMLCSRLLRAGRGGGLVALEEAHGRLLGRLLGHRSAVLLGALLVFGACMSLVRFVGTEFMPEIDSGDVNVDFRLPEGTRIEETHRVIERINAYMARIPEARSYYAYDGETKRGIGFVLGFSEGANVGHAGLKLVRKRHRRRSAKEVANELRERLLRYPGISRLTVRAREPITALFVTTTKPIDIEIMGTDLEQLVGLARRVKQIVQRVPGAVDVTLSQKEPRPELWIIPDRRKASTLGVQVASIARTVRELFYGYDPTEYREAGDDYDIFLRLRPQDRRRLDALEQATVPSATGKLVRLSNIVTVRESFGPVEIERKNRQRIVRVEADTYGRSLGEVVGDIRRAMGRLEIPPGVRIEFGGEVKEQREAFRDLTLLLLLGACLVYMVMASQFENLVHPLIIMFSVPFALCGVVLALLATGTALSIMSFIGMVMLVGIVVNNAIVLVDYANLLRRAGATSREAAIGAARRRLRPVLMTAITTIFGMLPMALSRGEGAEAWVPLGITVIGGLAVSTLLTLVLVPVLYHAWESRRGA